MDNLIEYKGYWTKVEYSAEDHVLYGKIEGIADLVNFECQDALGVEDAFKEAVDDYLAFCEDVGQEPNKAYKGSFNIRIPPELHRLADMKRTEIGISLNQIITRALEEYLHTPKKEVYTTFVVSESILERKAELFQRYTNPSIINIPNGSAEVSYVRN